MTTEKDLRSKAVDIKGKKYILVSDRVLFFNESYPNGSIETELVKFSDGIVVTKTTVTPDVKNPDRRFTGYAQEKEGDGYINKTSALENSETSSTGRALAMMGIGVIDSIASVDEINKARNRSNFESRYDEIDAKGFGLGNCPNCGAPNKPKKDGNGHYCSALCWKK